MNLAMSVVSEGLFYPSPNSQKSSDQEMYQILSMLSGSIAACRKRKSETTSQPGKYDRNKLAKLPSGLDSLWFE